MNERDEAANLSIEKRLRPRLAGLPDERLKKRIARAVNAELASSRASCKVPGGLAAFAALMAATLVICLNLSLSAASSITLGPRPTFSLPATEEDLSAVTDLDPELSRADAARIVSQLHAAAGLRLLPAIHASANPHSIHAGISDNRGTPR